MKGSRLLLALAACGVLAGAAGCEGTQTQSSPPDDPARVENASAEVGRIRMRQHTRPTSLSVDDLVVLGYMERLRLGLGSPFRLMEEVMNDSLLPESHRSIATLALLDAASQGHSYALAKRFQQWRAVVARADGQTVSINVAPSSATRSGAATAAGRACVPATTRAPRATRLRAIARPMPRLAPVTSAVRPSNVPTGVLPPCVRVAVGHRRWLGR